MGEILHMEPMEQALSAQDAAELERFESISELTKMADETMQHVPHLTNDILKVLKDAHEGLLPYHDARLQLDGLAKGDLSIMEIADKTAEAVPDLTVDMDMFKKRFTHGEIEAVKARQALGEIVLEGLGYTPYEDREEFFTDWQITN